MYSIPCPGIPRPAGVLVAEDSALAFGQLLKQDSYETLLSKTSQLDINKTIRRDPNKGLVFGGSSLGLSQILR